MEKHTLHNNILVCLSLLVLLGCFSIHAECRVVMDEMDDQNFGAHEQCMQTDDCNPYGQYPGDHSPC
ncbi:hypothetical protein BDA96_10G250100 [Sorghum bicolor]|uniref:Meg domain-containing protein n=1 Tax=Sorghum bicolor TaxID=4558 RepID=A0A921Q3Y4_SORBI|nr:hypothetical protein BDA96_10G250100 [Sorghum bicolor]